MGTPPILGGTVEYPRWREHPENKVNTPKSAGGAPEIEGDPSQPLRGGGLPPGAGVPQNLGVAQNRYVGPPKSRGTPPNLFRAVEYPPGSWVPQTRRAPQNRQGAPEIEGDPSELLWGGGIPPAAGVPQNLGVTPKPAGGPPKSRGTPPNLFGVVEKTRGRGHHKTEIYLQIYGELAGPVEKERNAAKRKREKVVVHKTPRNRPVSKSIMEALWTTFKMKHQVRTAEAVRLAGDLAISFPQVAALFQSTRRKHQEMAKVQKKATKSAQDEVFHSPLHVLPLKRIAPELPLARSIGQSGHSNSENVKHKPLKRADFHIFLKDFTRLKLHREGFDLNKSFVEEIALNHRWLPSSILN
ncbi:LOW QUALITY PROTEIN: uncharacterized protein LOC119921709 [Tachyglossus aculeatus]|uniref:LOW QUALITY PROTEIN: uncharacterized protein LOC119921709 n=1 Tax=Tachyglossus aculeatus TaxID=9261 RepID=UPI0018F33F0D|nr:LOW QUALITY PROTEIN: uncharacterized protein LOC119921709 [Tachyglossus aculeatus]